MQSRLGFERIAELLIRNHANVNVVAYDGKTALIYAAQKGIVLQNKT